MGRIATKLLLLIALGLATWGLVITVPALIHAEARYVSRPLYVVIMWSFIWIASAVVLVRSFRRR